MKKIFVVYDITENGKHFAFADTIRAGENLLYHISRYKGADACHLCETRKEADNLAVVWNQGYKSNGTYLYD